ncbi:MAG: MFS transporter [Hydrogenovibrio sp.]
MTAPTPMTPQQYIDETPTWKDGTQVSGAPMTAMQWRIWTLATAGKFFEGMVVFMTGVALPLIVAEFQLGAMEKGVIGAAILFGILIGATTLGGLADKYGRKRLFIAELILFVFFLAALTISPSFIFLALALFGAGLALGCDYPTAHLVISESIPSRSRGKLVLGAFGFQAVGALVGTMIGFLVLYLSPEVGSWRYMYAVAIIPALLVIAGRFFINESPHWLMDKGHTAQAEHELGRLLERDPKYPSQIALVKPPEEAEPEHERKQPGIKKLFKKKHRRATIFASVPWFLQDLGTYGIGIFTPIILVATFGHDTIGDDRNIADLVENTLQSAKHAAFLDVLLIVGMLFAIFLTDKIGRIKLQIFGFIGCAIGLMLVAFSESLTGDMKLYLIFIGFMLFNFMTNLGPNAQTYLIAGEVFPTKIRGVGAGFAASFAKIGAVGTAFLFPILLTDIGTAALLYILAGTSILGAWVTWHYRIETRGISLESIHHPQTENVTVETKPIS